jgi:hypothetical protein
MLSAAAGRAEIPAKVAVPRTTKAARVIFFNMGTSFFRRHPQLVPEASASNGTNLPDAT